MKRFWEKVDKSGDCWEWTGAKVQGYGQSYYQDKRIYAHRLSWVLEHGQIPHGLCVLHACDNPGCVRSDHLFLGTQLDNIRDRDNKGRQRNGDRRGERAGGAKLNNTKVRVMRAYKNLGTRQLSEVFSVSMDMVRRILSRRSWSHI